MTRDYLLNMSNLRAGCARRKLIRVVLWTCRKKLTKELPHDAGLPVKPVIPAGVGEITAIQRILPDYQIQRYTAQGGSLIYQGPEAPRKIYLILDAFNFSGNM